MPIITTSMMAQSNCPWPQILAQTRIVTGQAEARRLLGIGAVRLNGYTVGAQDRWDGHDGDVLKVGTRSFCLHPIVEDKG